MKIEITPERPEKIALDDLKEPLRPVGPRDDTTVTITEDITGKKTYTVHGNLILDKDSHYDGNLEVEGSIFGIDKKLFSLTVEGNIKALGIEAQDINAEDINAENIDARDINAYNIKAGDIDAWGIDALDIDAWGIDAKNIDAYNIDAYNIKAWDIKAGDIKAGDINAYNIKAGDINARNIKAEDINASGNIKAWDIKASLDIMCKTLKQKEGSVLTARNLMEESRGNRQRVIPRSGNLEVS